MGRIIPGAQDIMSQYNTRQIAEKLQRYACLLDAQLGHLSFIADVTQTDANHETRNSVENELKDTRDMAGYLWDIKESV